MRFMGMLGYRGMFANDERANEIIALYNKSIRKFTTKQQQDKFNDGINKTLVKLRNGELK